MHFWGSILGYFVWSLKVGGWDSDSVHPLALCSLNTLQWKITILDRRIRELDDTKLH